MISSDPTICVCPTLATRQHDMQIYQAMKYLSLDIAAFIEKGPHMTGPLRM
jgi:hypothetical protein